MATAAVRLNQGQGLVPSELRAWELAHRDYRPVPASLKDRDLLAGTDFKCLMPSVCNYQTVEGKPLNPAGRTGLVGKGKLYYWGANPAADLIIVRYHNGQPEFLAIKRSDSGKLAIPGGFRNKNENSLAAALREMEEEIFDCQPESANLIKQLPLRKVYEGYAEDPRNTDNAWIETAVYLVELPESISKKIIPSAGDDAKSSEWGNKGWEWVKLDADKIKDLYAAHPQFIQMAKEQLGKKESKDLIFPALAKRMIAFTKPIKYSAGKMKDQIEAAIASGAPDLDLEALARQVHSLKAMSQSEENLRQRLPGVNTQYLDYDYNGFNLSNLLEQSGNPETNYLLSLGGDGALVQLARSLAEAAIKDPEITNQLNVIGINSDPKLSLGQLLAVKSENLGSFLEKLQKGEVKTEHWPVIGCYHKGELLGLAISDINLGYFQEGQTSRYTVHLGEQKKRFKSSGLLLSTGVGSGCWLKNSGGAEFDHESRDLALFHRELSDRQQGQVFIDGERGLRVEIIRANNLRLTLDGYRYVDFMACGDVAKDYEKLYLDFRLMPYSISVITGCEGPGDVSN